MLLIEGDNPSALFEYTLAIINEIRSYVTAWRGLNNPADWGVTPVTQRLLQYWRHHEFESVRPFFCQVEAVETAIWLTEVAAKQKQHSHLWKHIQAANEGANSSHATPARASSVSSSFSSRMRSSATQKELDDGAGQTRPFHFDPCQATLIVR